tara:strand:+ start:1414 stop:2205 length:792 start_codon:yes stop_codon:yes gene_type:complete
LTIYQNKQHYYLDDNDSELKSSREKPRDGREPNQTLQDKLRRTKTSLKWNADLFLFKKDSPEMKEMFRYQINPSFGEPIFKYGCLLHTGYFTAGAEKDLHNNGKEKKNAKEHPFPRTTVGKIIANAIVYGTDDYDALNGDCSMENIYRWIDLNAHLFCSVIIASKEENERLNKLTGTKEEDGKEIIQYTFPQLLNLEHYRDVGLTLNRNLSRFNKYTKPAAAKKYQHLRDNPHLNPPSWTHLMDDSHFFPEIVTPAMKELVIA